MLTCCGDDGVAGGILSKRRQADPAAEENASRPADGRRGSVLLGSSDSETSPFPFGAMSAEGIDLDRLLILMRLPASGKFPQAASMSSAARSPIVAGARGEGGRDAERDREALLLYLMRVIDHVESVNDERAEDPALYEAHLRRQASTPAPTPHAPTPATEPTPVPTPATETTPAPTPQSKSNTTFPPGIRSWQSFIRSCVMPQCRANQTPTRSQVFFISLSTYVCKSLAINRASVWGLRNGCGISRKSSRDMTYFRSLSQPQLRLQPPLQPPLLGLNAEAAPGADSTRAPRGPSPTGQVPT